jgi:hypothetical protein
MIDLIRSSINFSLHLLSSRNSTILQNLPTDIVLLRCACTRIYLSISRGRDYAVHTALNISVRLFTRILSNLILAGFLRYSIFLSESIYSYGLASIAAATSIEVDYSLNTEISGRESSFSSTIDSIS